MKLYCESVFMSNLQIHTGKDTNTELNFSIGVSGSFIPPYLNKVHTVYTGNWYTSPALSLFLHRVKTSSSGTVCGNREGMPPPSQKLLVCEIQAVTSDSLMTMKWCDRQDVRMLFTLHSDEIVNTGKHDWKTKQSIMKPKCTVDCSCKISVQ